MGRSCAASNHALPDGNKRTALLCAILFANLNALDWEPPEADEPDGAETAEIVEAAAGGGVPLAALAAWVGDRLWHIPPRTAAEVSARVIFPAEYFGSLPYEDHTVRVGDLVIHDVHGYNPAGVYVRRIGGKTSGISVAEIIISAVGDRYAQEELDAENAEADRSVSVSRADGTPVLGVGEKVEAERVITKDGTVTLLASGT